MKNIYSYAKLILMQMKDTYMENKVMMSLS